MRRLRVLVVDDSAVIRALLTEVLSSDPEIEVIGTAHDPLIARRKIKDLNPDLITLDIHMPRMNGLEFLSKLMKVHPLPVVMIAGATDNAAQQVFEAINLGAVDFIHKPQLSDVESLWAYSDEIIAKVKSAGRVDLLRQEAIRAKRDRNANRQLSLASGNADSFENQVIAVGASTGGTDAISNLLSPLPVTMPGIVVVQHIPPVFSTSFAQRLDHQCQLEVLEADQGMRVKPGRVVLAPGDQHLKLRKDHSGIYCELSRDHKVNHHRPSVDVMFESCTLLPIDVIAVLLTGMGSDGALGMAHLNEQGTTTIAQDESSSVVWGMPGAAVKKGVVDYVESIDTIPELLVKLVDKRTRNRRRTVH